MSKYTTGEIAKICGVTVRTVQYYDKRGILVPSELSEGGRRLYSQEDLSKMKIICFLRELDLPISSIGKLFSEEHPEKVISILLEQQQAELKSELEAGTQKLEKLEQLQKQIKSISNFTVNSIGDVVKIMKSKKDMRKVRGITLAIGLIMELFEIVSIVLWIKTGNWIPFAVGMPIYVALAIMVVKFYYKRTNYICPECHNVFKPAFKEFFFSSHTPRTRKLTCPECEKKSYCVEIYDDGESLQENK